MDLATKINMHFEYEKCPLTLVIPSSPVFYGGYATLREKPVSHTILRECLDRSQCRPAAAEGAKLSKMRRGNALLAGNGVSDPF